MNIIWVCFSFSCVVHCCERVKQRRNFYWLVYALAMKQLKGNCCFHPGGREINSGMELEKYSLNEEVFHILRNSTEIR
jgi:hypothetical protein